MKKLTLLFLLFLPVLVRAQIPISEMVAQAQMEAGRNSPEGQAIAAENARQQAEQWGHFGEVVVDAVLEHGPTVAHVVENPESGIALAVVEQLLNAIGYGDGMLLYLELQWGQENPEDLPDAPDPAIAGLC